MLFFLTECLGLLRNLNLSLQVFLFLRTMHCRIILLRATREVMTHMSAQAVLEVERYRMFLLLVVMLGN